MATTKSLYGVHPGVLMTQKWVAELKFKTGRSLDEWLALVKKSGPTDEKSRREWLKTEHGLGTNSAWWIAERAEGKGLEADDPERYLAAAEKYVEAMFSGGKSGLRPLYDRLLKLGLGIGKDVKACPCQTIVPLYPSRPPGRGSTSGSRSEHGKPKGGSSTPAATPKKTGSPTASPFRRTPTSTARSSAGSESRMTRTRSN